MATIVVSTYMVRYPVGGSLSWALQWLVGLDRLGHEVYAVERSGYPDACFDPARGVMGDDVDAPHRRTHHVPVEEVDLHSPGARASQPLGPLRGLRDTGHVVSRLNQAWRRRPADDAGCPGEQHLHL